jgi:hypothetical protein
MAAAWLIGTQPEQSGVLSEIVVARRLEQVEGEALMLEAHHRRGEVSSREDTAWQQYRQKRFRRLKPRRMR